MTVPLMQWHSGKWNVVLYGSLLVATKAGDGQRIATLARGKRFTGSYHLLEAAITGGGLVITRNRQADQSNRDVLCDLEVMGLLESELAYLPHLRRVWTITERGRQVRDAVLEWKGEPA